MASKYNSRDQPAIFYRQVVVNLFHFFLAASKFCLLPFLTLYLKFLGLEPLHVGLIFSVHALLPILSKWTCTKCATSCGFRRAVLMLSIFCTILGYVVIMLVPPKTPSYNENFLCKSQNESNDQVFTSPKPLTTSNDIFTKIPQFSKIKIELSTELSHKITNGIELTTHLNNLSTKIPSKQHSDFDSLSPQQQKLLFQFFKSNKFDINKFRKLRKDKLMKILEVLEKKRIHRSLDEATSTPKPDLIAATLNKVTSGVHKMADKLKNVKNKTLLFVLLAISGISLFGSSIEPVAEDIWYDFLDRYDRLDKYGGHLSWYDIGSIWTPLALGAAVEFGNCERIMHLPTIYLFFLSFACLMGFCIVLSLFFPDKSAQRKQKFLFGIRTTFGDIRSIILTITAAVSGFASSTVEIFLFWKMFKEGNWLSLGIVVSASRVGQFVSSTIVGRALKNLIFFETCLGIFFMAAGLVWCSLVEKAGGLWLTPACIGILGFGKGFLISARYWHTEFRLNSILINRRALAIVNHFENHIGFGVGALIAGPIYAKWGVEVLMQCGAILLGMFFIINIIVAKCSPIKPIVKYSKLLPDVELDDDDDEEDDESDKEEDDWLEHALIRDKMKTKVVN